MKWRKLYKEEIEEGAFKVGDRVRVADTYKGEPTIGGRFSYDPPSVGMTGIVVDINRQRYHDFKSGSMGLGMSREKTRMWYIVKIDDSCRKGYFVPGEYGFDEKDLVKIDAVNESDEQVNLKKLLKLNGVTKLPSGTVFKLDRVSWSKDGGYAGQKTLGKMRDVLEDAGWKKGEWKPDGSPDGSWVSNSDSYTSPDGRIVMSYYSYYGATSRDNIYGFAFKLVENPVNESREDDMVATLVKIDENGEEEIESKQVTDYWEALGLLEDYAIAHFDDDEWVAEKYAKYAAGENEHAKEKLVGWLAKNGKIGEEFLAGGYDIELRVKAPARPGYPNWTGD